MNFIELTVILDSGLTDCSAPITNEVQSALSKKYELAYFYADSNGFTVVVEEGVNIDDVKMLISSAINAQFKSAPDKGLCNITHKVIDKSQLAMLQLTKPSVKLAAEKDTPAPESPSTPESDSDSLSSASKTSTESESSGSDSVPISEIIRRAKAASGDSSSDSSPVTGTTLSPSQVEEWAQKQREQRVEKAKGTQTLEKIRNLIGAGEFKALAEEISKIAPVIAKNETYDILTSRAYLFSIGDGNGLSTYLSLFADLMEELGLFTFDAQHRIIEHRLGEDPQAFNIALECFKCYNDKAGRLVCFDVSDWMSRHDSRDFRDFLSRLPQFVGRHLVVFRIPFLEKEVVQSLNNAYNDRICMRLLTFLPFDTEELIFCAKREVEKYGFTVAEDAWPVFNARITDEKNDGRFYGIETVNKVVRDMVYLKQLSMANSGVESDLITKDDILTLSVSYTGDSVTGIDVLDTMVGMADIKQRVIEITTQIEMAMKNDKLDRPCIHMRFVGNPGTGKTTVARVLGQILKEKGILRTGSFFEHSGREFCGRYVGETAPKTAAMCRDAYGSVLFIDEAYTLFRDEGNSRADYGREALDTLISEMENHRTDLVVIMAGYPDEMKGLMKANPGLESRMPYVINFPNYTREQLTQIFLELAHKCFPCGEGFDETVTEFFANLSDEVIEAKDFSNARFVRNLFERTWGKSALRSQMNKSEEVVLEKEDFLAASSDNEFESLISKKKKTLGFV